MPKYDIYSAHKLFVNANLIFFYKILLGQRNTVKVFTANEKRFPLGFTTNLINLLTLIKLFSKIYLYKFFDMEIII